MNKEKAEYISNKANDLMSRIYKDLSLLESLMLSEPYQLAISSFDKEVQEVVENGALPPDFLTYLELLPEMF
jgi:hypothetical protein